MDAFVITISFLLIGMALRRIPAFPDGTGNVLNQFVIFVSLPAMVLLKVPRLTLSASLLVPALLPWIMLFFSAGFVLLLSRLLRWDRSTTGCLLLLIPLGNTSFLGIPMVQAFFGEQAIPYALLYDQIGSFLGLVTYGSFILAAYGAGGSRPTVARVLRRIVTFPPFIALVLAFALKAFTYPTVLLELLDVLASTLVPLVMTAVGFQLSLHLRREVVSQVSVGLAIKLVAAPLIALLVCRLFGLQGEAVSVSIFEAGMPPMVTAGVLAISADLSPKLTSALVGIGIVVSFLTLPLLFQLLS